MDSAAARSRSLFRSDMIGELLYTSLERHVLTEELLEKNGYPRLNPDIPGRADVPVNACYEVPKITGNVRPCNRCNASFDVTTYEATRASNKCIYHYARYPCKDKRKGGMSYPCCWRREGTPGCQRADNHVHKINMYTTGSDGFVETEEPKAEKEQNKHVFALDCEMIYTVAGMELARVTVVDDKEKVVYDSVVKPATPIIDYNTRFSGMKESDFRGISTSLEDVQKHLLTMISSRTILVGQSLESDLLAIKMIHRRVVDTSVMFPHPDGPPKKRALRYITKDILFKTIQHAGVGGHDSAEDSRSCMQLVKWQVLEDHKKNIRK